MAKNGKNYAGMSYSLKIGPSTYYVSSHRTKNLNYTNDYILAEDATIRSKSAKTSVISSPRSQHSKSQKSLVSPERQPKTSYFSRLATDININNQLQRQQQCMLDQTHHRRYTPSRCKKTSRTPEKVMRTEQKILFDKFSQEANKKNNSFTKSIKHKRKTSIETISNSQKEEIIRIFNEQKHLLMQSIEQHVRTITTSSTHIIKEMVTEVLQSQDQLTIKKFENTLVQTIQQELEKTLPKTLDESQPNSFDVSTLNRLENILTQVIENSLATVHKIDSTTLNHMLMEQKQASIETSTQNQSLPITDLIKKSVIDALNQYNSQFSTIRPTTYVTNPRYSNTSITNKEINITANLSQTRVDAAFRQQRDTIMANRYLRETVRQWSNVRSISSLVKKIQACGTNDVEHAWLLFCWMSQNIFYDSYCQNYLAESIFQNRTGACQGFVNLYYECCLLLNIECLKISGYMKETFLKKKEDLKKLSHSWNAIVLDQYTYLVDSTLGAHNYQNSKHIGDFYFLISPEEFIYSHYSKGYQLLQPEITKEEFLSLPIVKSNYYRLNLSLLSPKQVHNQTNDNIFKISIKTPAYVDLFARLKIDDIEYPSHLHTLCQRDLIQTDIVNCFIAPPTDGVFQITIYAKTIGEKIYQDTLHMRLNSSNVIQPVTFPITYPPFIDYKCILIEPFRRIVHKNECLLIQMKIPDANMIKIKNGDEYFIPNKDEYKNGFEVVRKRRPNKSKYNCSYRFRKNCSFEYFSSFLVSIESFEEVF